MADYNYTKNSLLDNPNQYMYTQYQGGKFLNVYFKDRVACLKDFRREGIKVKNRNSINSSILLDAIKLLNLFLKEEFFNKKIKPFISYKGCNQLSDSFVIDTNDDIKDLTFFSIDERATSKDLLLSLINSQINQTDEVLVKFWIDLLVQKFEVTKKIFESYPVGFRKGEGRNDIIKLYWMFSVSLALFYRFSNKIKYLNTLIKVSDLLCSLDNKLLYGEIPPQGLLVTLLVELLSVAELSENIDEVNFEFK